MLGIEVERDQVAHTISFSQHTYIMKILEQFGLQDTNPLSTPLDLHHRLTLAQCPNTPQQYEAMKNIPYHKAVRSLMYAALGTQLDITFSVIFLCNSCKIQGMLIGKR